jgi:coproporphyrinogen III oxidase
MFSASKQKYNEQFVVIHLDVLKCQFESRELTKNLIENTDEIHFNINYDNGKILGFKSDEHTKYVDIVRVVVKDGYGGKDVL